MHGLSSSISKYLYIAGNRAWGPQGKHFCGHGDVPAPGARDGTRDMGRDTGRDMGLDTGRDTERDTGRDTRKSSLHWGWLSSGITCMAMFAAFPSTIMDSTTVVSRRSRHPTVVEAAKGRLHNGGWEAGKHSHTSNPR